MHVELIEEQRMLQDSVRKFVESEVPLEKVRELAEDPAGLPDSLWRKIAEQGWLGLIIPEEYGGLGLGAQELGVVCEEFGRGVVPGPFLSTALAARAIALAGSEDAKQAWLEHIAAGEIKGALALLEQNADLHPAAVQCAAVAGDDAYILNGTKFLVPDAGAADLFIVPARSERGVSLFVVEKTTPGVSVKPNRLTDQTSRSGQLYLKNAVVPASNRLGAEGSGQAVIDEVLLLANVCLAADCVAGAEYIHRKTVAYAKERTQFGKLIGSFQAVKHPLVDVFTLIESAKSAYHYAAWAVDAKSEDARGAAAVARLTAAEAYRRSTLDGLQAHGGIAFTWEYDLHLYLKRAKHNQYLYGVPGDYEELIAKEVLGL